MSLLHLANRQKTRLVDRRLLRRVARCLLEELLGHDSYELAVHLIGATEMARLNYGYLRHEGSTDVLTFNHQEGAAGGGLSGEIFISVDDALVHARRFGVSWQSEVVRYLAHGLLHLEGFDDTAPGPRREMKRQENKLLKELSRRFDLGKLGGGQNGDKRE
jgi:probable rRNA maturation factor